jgi:nucleotide-binding universal stress UspA family protein
MTGPRGYDSPVGSPAETPLASPSLEQPTARSPGVRGIVVGVDGSPNSIAALREAAKIAAERAAPLRAVFVYAPTSPITHVLTGAEPAVDPTATTDTDRATALAVLQQCVADAFSGQMTPTLTLLAIPGNARQVLTTMSQQADLLVVGARGQSVALRLAVGATARACAQQARCPVLLVPDEQPTPAAAFH